MARSTGAFACHRRAPACVPWRSALAGSARCPSHGKAASRPWTTARWTSSPRTACLESKYKSPRKTRTLQLPVPGSGPQPEILRHGSGIVQRPQGPAFGWGPGGAAEARPERRGSATKAAGKLAGHGGPSIVWSGGAGRAGHRSCPGIGPSHRRGPGSCWRRRRRGPAIAGYGSGGCIGSRSTGTAMPSTRHGRARPRHGALRGAGGSLRDGAPRHPGQQRGPRSIEPRGGCEVEDFDLTVDVNLKGTFFASQAAARIMIPQGSGRIINLSSQAGFVALPTESVYCMTKAAIAHLTKCLAIEWGTHGITVTGVAPTFIRTPGTKAALSDPAFERDVTERIAALHRIGEPMDVAGVVVFLASPAASLITGETILVDGGWTAR